MASTKFVKGGKNLERLFKRARAAQRSGLSVKQVEVGFFESARYPEVHQGTGPRAGKKREPLPVTTVAAWHEFGLGNNPERPFFRNAIEGSAAEIMPIIKAGIDPRTMTVNAQLARKIGLVMEGRIKRSLTELKDPPNTPATIEQKGRES